MFKTGDHGKGPAPPLKLLKARTRKKYLVFLLSPVMLEKVALGPTVMVTRFLVKVLLVAIWMVKPASLLELSCQLRVRDVCVTLVADRFEGAAGGVASGGTVPLAVFE